MTAYVTSESVCDLPKFPSVSGSSLGQLSTMLFAPGKSSSSYFIAAWECLVVQRLSDYQQGSGVGISAPKIGCGIEGPYKNLA